MAGYSVLISELLQGAAITTIARIRPGWTTLSNADKYEALLREEIFAGIQKTHIRGSKVIQFLRREVSDEVEFTVFMSFDSLDTVREFAGEDYEQMFMPEKARRLLSRFAAL